MIQEITQRPIDEEFYYKGVKLKVEKATAICEGCYFNSNIRICPEDTIGNCGHNTREDDTDIIFKRIG